LFFPLVNGVRHARPGRRVGHAGAGVGRHACHVRLACH
jgi:hypothetical protein